MGAAALGLSVAGAAYSAYSQQLAGKVSQSYYNYLSSNANANASIAQSGITANRMSIGAAEADSQRRLTNNINATAASQKAALAAGGAGAGSRTAQDIIGNTEMQGNLDEMALRYNADMKAKAATIQGTAQGFGFKTQALGDTLSGSIARSTANAGAASTIIGGAGSVANQWYRMPMNYGMNGYAN